MTRKLRRGDWSIQRQIDLHGLRRDDAREALSLFIREAHQQGIRCVRVVHGKGLGSPGKAPILKNRVHSWLVQKNEVLAFVQAKPADGGAGAVTTTCDQRRAESSEHKTRREERARHYETSKNRCSKAPGGARAEKRPDRPGVSSRGQEKDRRTKRDRASRISQIRRTSSTRRCARIPTSACRIHPTSPASKESRNRGR